MKKGIVLFILMTLFLGMQVETRIVDSCNTKESCQNQLSEVMNKIQELGKQVLDTEKQVVTIKQQQEELQHKINNEDQLVRKRLLDSQFTLESNKMLEFFADSSSMSDFVSRFLMLDELNTADQERIQLMFEQKKQLHQNEEELERKQVNMEMMLVEQQALIQKAEDDLSAAENPPASKENPENSTSHPNKSNDEKKDNTQKQEQQNTQSKSPSQPTPITPQIQTLTYVKGILIVNKKHGLPSTYNPGENPEALTAFRRMQRDMQARGLPIGNAYSGFRSYNTQSRLYNGYVAQDGQTQADTYSARPGYSEHQTGLAFDLISTNGQLVQDQASSRWIVSHCAEYGFILRYPSGKENITGYRHETWHVRYVGNIATQIMSQNLTLEEYLDISGGNYA